MHESARPFLTQRWHGRESSQVKCAFWQCKHARFAFLRLLDPVSLGVDAAPLAVDPGVPVEEAAGLIGVDVVAADGPAFDLRSTSCLSGEPMGDLFDAFAEGLEAGEDAFEYKL